MSYNPFDFFRKYQKTLFAGLTVMVMFMFVLSFGQGDFFQWLPEFISKKRPSGNVMAVIDGSKIRESELSKLHFQRNLANQFMIQGSVRYSIPKLQTSLRDAQSRVSQNTKKLYNDWLARIQEANSNAPFVDENRKRQAAQEASRLELLLAETAESDKVSAEDRDFAQTHVRFLNLVQRLGQGRNEQFFIMQPNRTSRDDLEFMLWQKKADSLGIQFNQNDLEELIRDELPRITRDDQEKLIRELIENRRGMKSSEIYDAIREEFRVQAAQQVVLGWSGKRPPRGLASPYDLFTFYRTETTRYDYAVVSVPVENFIRDVPGEPSITELRDIFNKAKNVEPEPSSPRAALKEPRKLKLQWIEATGNEPFYAAAAADWLKKVEVLGPLAGLFMQGTTNSPIGFATTVSGLTLADPIYADAYEKYKSQHGIDIRFRWYIGSTDRQFLDTSLVRPQAIGSMVALLGSSAVLGSGVAPIPYHAPLATVETVATNAERLERIRAGAALLFMPTLPSIASFTSTAIAHKLSVPEPLPLKVVKPTIVAETAKQMQSKVFVADLKKFEEEMRKATEGSKDKAAEGQKKLTEFLAARPGVRLGQSENFEGMYTIGQDPGLKPLVQKFASPHGGLDNSVARFGKQFFIVEGFNFGPGMSMPDRPNTSFYDPRPYPNPDLGSLRPNESQFMVWLMDELPAKSPAAFEAVKDRCVQIWKQQKARDLARTAATQLSEKLASTSGGFQDVRQAREEFASRFSDQAARERVKYFTVESVAPILIDSLPGSPARPFELKPTTDLPFPNDKMRSELLALNAKPRGASTVLTDNPEMTFYVASQQISRPPGEYEFQEHMFPAMRMGVGPEFVVKAQFEGKALRQARDEAIALLKAEFRYEKEHEKLDEKRDSSSDE